MKIILLTIFAISFLSISSNAQYQNVRVDGPSASQPEEVSIAINPTNPNYISAGANIDHFFRSTDGGLTWTTSFMTNSVIFILGIYLIHRFQGTG
jgi:hypothetical protein